MSKTPTQTERVATRGLWRASAIAAITAAVANTIVFALSRNLFGVPFMMPVAPGSAELGPLSVVQVIVFSAIPGLAATGLLAILGRTVSRPFTVFWAISGAFLLLSFVPDFLLPVAAATKTALILMHVVAAVVIVGVLTTLGRER